MKYLPLLFMGLLAISLAACTTNATPEKQIEPKLTPAIPVVVENISISKEAIPVRATGTLAAQEEMRLGFKIGGVIQAVYVNEGETVRQGQELARLIPTEINAQVSQAKSAVDKAERDLTRVKQLYADSVTTLEQVQDLTTALEVAQAALEGAEFNQDQAIIYAPTSGQILRRFSEKGEVVSPGTPVVMLASRGKNQVLKTGLSDVEVVQVSLGDKAEIQFDAYPGEVFSAQVSQIAAGADPFTGTFEVELQLASRRRSLKNGFVGKATIFPNNQIAYIRLPMSALVEADAEKAVIFVPDSSQTLARQLIIDQFQIRDEYLAIPLHKLQAETSIITEGAKYLSPNAPIKIITDDSVATIGK